MNKLKLLQQADTADLNIYQRALLMHVILMGRSWESTRTLGQSCGMGKSKASTAKTELIKAGWLEYVGGPGRTKAVQPVDKCPPHGQGKEVCPSHGQDGEEARPPHGQDEEVCPCGGQKEGVCPPHGHHLSIKNNNNIADDILSFMGFDGVLEKDDPADTAELLAWAWGIKIKKRSRPDFNFVGNARIGWRKGRKPPANLIKLAQAWLLLADREKWQLIIAAEEYRQQMILPEDFPHPDVTAAFWQVYKATSGVVAPTSLLPQEPRPVFVLQGRVINDVGRSLYERRGGTPNPMAQALQQVIDMTGFETLRTCRLYANGGSEAIIYTRTARVAERINKKLAGRIGQILQIILDRPEPMTVKAILDGQEAEGD